MGSAMDKRTTGNINPLASSLLATRHKEACAPARVKRIPLQDEEALSFLARWPVPDRWKSILLSHVRTPERCGNPHGYGGTFLTLGPLKSQCQVLEQKPPLLSGIPML